MQSDGSLRALDQYKRNVASATAHRMASTRRCASWRSLPRRVPHHHGAAAHRCVVGADGDGEPPRGAGERARSDEIREEGDRRREERRERRKPPTAHTPNGAPPNVASPNGAGPNSAIPNDASPKGANGANPRARTARTTVSFRAERAGRRRGIAIVPTEGLALYREECDSSPPPLSRLRSE